MSAPIVKHFPAKKACLFGQNLTVLGDKYGFNIKFKFCNPEKAHPCVISRLMSYRASYAAVVWWTRVDYSTVDKQLEHVQRIACLYITGAIRTTPTSALEVITGLTPLAIFLKQEAMTACFRLRMNKQWKHIPFGHARINREYDEIAPATCSKSDSIIAQYVFDKNYEVSIPDRSD